MALTKRQENKLDKEIEQTYYRLGNRREINIMKIGALFSDAKRLHLSGVPMDQAVQQAIETHCEPLKENV